MKSHAGKLTSVVVLLVVSALAAGAFVWSGLYNIGADDPHTRATYTLLETLRERSIDSRASKLTVPDLSDPAKGIQGAGNYNAMCVGCHLAPGMEASELSKGLYPAPPNLTTERVEVAQAFWVIKHGIKASGMPAWGKSMDDAYIWNMAAFLQKLPSLDATQYQAMVGKSGGHSHGGGESGHQHSHEEGLGAGESEHAHEHREDAHSHESGEADEHHDEASEHHHDDAAMPATEHNEAAEKGHAHDDHAASAEKSGAAAMTTHTHANGTVESHPAKSSDKTDDHKDHQH